VCIGADRAKEANAKRLHREFSDIAFKTGESVEDFSLLLSGVVSELCVLGDNVPDKEVIKWLLHVVPDKLEHVVISMEALLDLNVLALEEVVGHLHIVEQRRKPTPAKESGGCLLLTEEEWMARMKSKDGSGSSSETHHGGRNGSGCKNRGGKAGGEQKS
jgi:hypothetical protein